MIDTRHALRADQDGDEALLPLFVMAASMLIAIIVLSTAIASAIARNTPTAKWEQSEGWDLIGGVDYNLLEPTSGYNVTIANHTGNPYTDVDAKTFDFVFSDWDTFAVRLVRDSWIGYPPYLSKYTEDSKYEDFIYIHCRDTGGWFGGNRYVAIDYHSMTTRFLTNNLSYAYFTVFKSNFTVMLETATNSTNPADHINAIWFGNYRLYIAVNAEIGDASRMSASMWTILGQILSLQLPETTRIINLLLAIPIWAAMGFMVFTILSRVVPFISGG